VLKTSVRVEAEIHGVQLVIHSLTLGHTELRHGLQPLVSLLHHRPACGGKQAKTKNKNKITVAEMFPNTGAGRLLPGIIFCPFLGAFIISAK
jgi:hypothetical protein